MCETQKYHHPISHFHCKTLFEHASIIFWCWHVQIMFYHEKLTTKASQIFLAATLGTISITKPKNLLLYSTVCQIIGVFSPIHKSDPRGFLVDDSKLYQSSTGKLYFLLPDHDRELCICSQQSDNIHVCVA